MISCVKANLPSSVYRKNGGYNLEAGISDGGLWPAAAYVLDFTCIVVHACGFPQSRSGDCLTSRRMGKGPLVAVFQSPDTLI